MRFLLPGIALTLLPLAAHAGKVESETVTNPYPGIELTERIESGPNNRIYVARISLCASKIHLTATKNPTSFQTPAAWGAAEGVQLAVNGDFFASGPQVYGDAVGGGVPWPVAKTGNSQPAAWYYHDYGWIAFGDDWVEFNHTKQTKNADAAKFNISQGWRPGQVTEDLPSGTNALVSGFPELVIEGQVYTCVSPTDPSCFPDRTDMRARHPRTAMGLNEDRSEFILVVVDGRDGTASVGMYGSELATLMGQLGAWQAFNLDGGGSSAMWTASGGYENQPSDGSARSVGNHWGVFAGDQGAMAADPGSCFVPGGCFPSPLPGGEAEPFVDMPPGVYGKDEAAVLLTEGITSGCGNDPGPMFCPNCLLARRQLAVFAARAGGLDIANPPATPTFDDVGMGNSAYAYVEAVVAAGWMEGCGGANFCPGDPVPRGMIAQVIARAQGWGAGAGGPTYGDVPGGHPYAADVEALVEHCIDVPCAADSFCPDQPAERDDTAVLLVRGFGLDGNPPCDPPTGTTGGETSTASGGSSGATSGGSASASGSASGTGAGTSASGSGTDSTGVDVAGFPDGYGQGGAGGCACTTRSRSAGGAWLLGLLAAARRRRRGRS